MQAKFQTNKVVVLFMASMLTSAPVFAEKPSWAGNEKGDKREQNGRQGDSSKRDSGMHALAEREGRDGGRHEYFGDQQRSVVREYYAELFRKGRCPPGLAKKSNGCVPPGQVKRWEIGRPLPREVTYYDLPPAVVIKIGLPPEGHRYVRVASDILLIAVGTGMIVDAIEDLSR